MNPIPVIAIFDIGKTNKKVFLFDEAYEVVYEKAQKMPEITDEDGFPCDDVNSIEQFVKDALLEISGMQNFELRAVNFTAYGASFVCVDAGGKPVAPLYNYLKPYPQELRDTFYNRYGGEEYFSMITASPVLGSLNSGMQVYRMKYEHPEVYARMQFALHLPQYLSFLVSGKAFSDITSVGCHTNLWDFTRGEYHQWVKAEQVDKKLAPLASAKESFEISLHGRNVKVGIGLHDSSSALIPYLVSFSDPIGLISTGTWCITLNPYNKSPLTPAELKADCLCYMSFENSPVKAARLFAGNEHELQLPRIAAHFGVDTTACTTMPFDVKVVSSLKQQISKVSRQEEFSGGLTTSLFGLRNLDEFANHIEAYHQLMIDLVDIQVQSAALVLDGTPVKKVFVDGGFSHNDIFMNLLANAMPQMEVFAASLAQASALGAAMAIHHDWNSRPVPQDLIKVKSIR